MNRHRSYYWRHHAEVLVKAKIWRDTNKRRWLYGLSNEEYQRLRALQNDRCAICGRHQSTLKVVLSVDHNHVTGKVRGLLCIGCNVKLGVLENLAWMACAENYLGERI